MHNPLEEYLTELSNHLALLPVKRRNEELKEMRQHLLDAVLVNREFGQSQVEATINAIEQFGLPSDLATQITQAWWRGVKLKRRDFWGAAACTIAARISFVYIVGPLMRAVFSFLSMPNKEGFLPYYPPLLMWLGTESTELSYFGVFLLSGWLSGVLFPRKVVAGTALAAGVWAVSRWLMAFIHPAPTDLSYPRVLLLVSFLVIYVSEAALTILAVFLGSRWRNTWTARGRQRHTQKVGSCIL